MAPVSGHTPYSHHKSFFEEEPLVSKLMDTNKKIEEAVVSGYKAIENGVVSGYKAIEDGVVGGYKKMEGKIVGAFLTPDKPPQDEAAANDNQEGEIQ